MNFKTIQVLLVIICVHRSTPIEAGKDKISTIWTYHGKNNDTTLLPDSIQIDFKTESEEIHMNLIKQSIGSVKPPLIMMQFQGQRSVWNPIEFLGSYTDPSLQASATVAIKKGEGFEEIFYRITFTHNNKSFSLEPVGVHSPATKKDNKGDNVENKNKILFKIDGRLHSLVETPATTTNRNVHFDDHVMEKDRVKKRSVQRPANKRLMTIEVYAIIDNSIFDYFFKRSKAVSDKGKKEDARKTIFYIFTHIMEGVRQSYESIDSNGLKFTVKWVGALIAESVIDEPFIESSKIDPDTLDSSKVLKELHQWISSEENKSSGHKLPNYDFLVVFTSHYLKYLSRNIVGLANIDTVCSTNSLGLVMYDEFFNTAATTSHELGHCLDISHDDETTNCKAEDNFIMAPNSQDQFLNNTFRFSECSVRNLEDKVKDLDKWNENCLVGEGEYVASGQEREVFLNLFPGQIYNLDDQCKFIYGSKSFYCGGGKADQKMCQSISCFTAKGCVAEYMALDGTSCSMGSWCIRGECVTDSKAPRAPKHCTHGDYKPSRLNNSELFCKDEVNRDPVNKCNQKDVKMDCCASCEGNRTKNGGCQDTTNECLSLEPSDCYNGYYAITCCKTCSALVQNPSNVKCLYGDKGVNCQDMIPAVCHLATQYCCQTCAAYHSSVTKIVSSTITATTTTTTSPSKTTTLLTTSSTKGPTIVPITTPFGNLSSKGDFRGFVQYIDVLGAMKSYESCKELIEYDPSLCYYVDVVGVACSASCRSLEDYCINGDMDGTCEELVEYDSSSCHNNRVRSRCCKACEDILRKSIKVTIVML